MYRRTVLTAIGLALTAMSTTIVTSAGHGKHRQGQSPHALSFGKKLQVIVPEFESKGRSLAEVAVKMAYQNKLPMGIEYVSRDALRRPLHLKVRHQNIRELIASLVAAVPGYQVDFSQGLVDIYSPAARRNASNPFNTVIRRYDVEGLDTHEADAQLLCAIGEQVHPHSGCGGSIAPGQWGPLKITLHLENKRVYEILNAIVAQNGRALWTPLAVPVNLSGIVTNFWYIYPLDPPFQRAVLDGLP